MPATTAPGTLAGFPRALLFAAALLAVAATVCAWARPEFGEFVGLSILRQGLEHPLRSALGLALVRFSLFRTSSSAGRERPGTLFGPYKKGA